ncbi:MAG: hypothetical protein ACKOD5_09245 [Chthoniobacterales bacterium]
MITAEATVLLGTGSVALGDHARNCHPGDFAVTTHYVSRGKRKVCLQ